MVEGMLRARAVILFCILLTFLADQGLLSKTRKKGVSRARYSSARHVKHKKEAPRPPDPALEWTDSGGNRLAGFFGNDITSTRIAPVKGDIVDLAVRGDVLYVLVNNFNLVSDAIFSIDRHTGRIQTIWGIGRLGAEAITCDDRHIWIISRSEKYFIRKLTFSGKTAGSVGIRSLPEGAIRGLACAGDVLTFAVRRGDGSALFQFNPSGRRLKEIGSYRGMIGGVASCQGGIVAYLNEFDRYAEHWLLMFDPSGVMKKKLRFVDTGPVALAGDGKRIYCMVNGQGGAVVSPVAILEDRNLVLAGPAVRRITVTIPVTGRNSSPYNADLWVPYPSNRRFQNVRQISIDPAPREITEDRFGNRWARLRFDRATGSVRAVLRFDIITAAAAQTVGAEGDFVPGGESGPAPPGETSVFDISHYVVKSHSSNIVAGGTCLSRVLAVRDYVNDAIRFTAYGDRWVKASDYLFRGRGDAYGQTVGFTALSRVLGIPARAAGGLAIGQTGREDGQEPTATWNQVYMPGTGWVDIGLGRDYDRAKESFAVISNGYCVMFEGDFDVSDYRSVFAEAEWSRVCRWSGTDPGGGADVVTGPVSITVVDLKE